MEVREDWGTAALKVRTGERGATMAVFSRSLVPALSELPAQVERLVRQARPAESDGLVLHGRLAGARAGRKRCDRCGQVIPRRYGVCPACLEKGKLLFRLLGYAGQHWRLITLSLLLMVVATTLGLSQPLLLSVLIDDVLNVGAPVSSTGDGAGFDLLALLPGAGDDPVAALAWLVGLLILINFSVSGLSGLRGFMGNPPFLDRECSGLHHGLRRNLLPADFTVDPLSNPRRGESRMKTRRFMYRVVPQAHGKY